MFIYKLHAFLIKSFRALLILPTGRNFSFRGGGGGGGGRFTAKPRYLLLLHRGKEKSNTVTALDAILVMVYMCFSKFTCFHLFHRFHFLQYISLDGVIKFDVLSDCVTNYCILQFMTSVIV